MRIKSLAPCKKETVYFRVFLFYFYHFPRDLSGLATRRRCQGKKGLPVHNVPPRRKFVNALDLFFFFKKGEQSIFFYKQGNREKNVPPCRKIVIALQLCIF